MTRTETTLRKAGLPLDGITFNGPREIEVAVLDADGDVNVDATGALADWALHELGGEWGGYRTGYGAWILRKSYRSAGDWNDKSSRHHY